MVDSEKAAGVVTPFDAQKLCVVRAPELLLPVWFEEIPFIHIGAAARGGGANEGHGTIHILLLFVVLPK